MCAFAVVGCGRDRRPSTSDAGPRTDSGTGGRDADTTDDAGSLADAGRDAGGEGPLPEVDGVVSDPAGMRWVPMVATDCVDLVSSNLTERRIAGSTSVLREWYAEIDNVCAYPICAVRVEAEFSTASGLLAQITGIPDLPAYEYGTSFRSQAGCLPPGVHAGLYGNESGSSFDPFVTEVTSGTWGGSGIQITGSVPAVAVSLTGTGWAPPADGVGDWVYAGSVFANETVRNLKIAVYPISERGVIDENAVDFHLDPLYASSTWRYEAGALFGVPRPTRQIAPVVSFLFGAAVLGPEATAEDRAVAQRVTENAALVDQRNTRQREHAALLER